jgi:hypothetical protein
MALFADCRISKQVQRRALQGDIGACLLSPAGSSASAADSPLPLLPSVRAHRFAGCALSAHSCVFTRTGAGQAASVRTQYVRIIVHLFHSAAPVQRCGALIDSLT